MRGYNNKCYSIHGFSLSQQALAVLGSVCGCETCPQRVQTRFGEAHPWTFSLLMLPWPRDIWDLSPVCTCSFQPRRLLLQLVSPPSNPLENSDLLFSDPDGQPKKVRKVPPGLPSSVSGSSMFPISPCPGNHPCPLFPGAPNTAGWDFSGMGKGFPV